jgi:transketolase
VHPEFNGQLDQLCINTVRFLAVDAVERAKSGHPGMPMGAAPMAYVLWTRFLRHNPADPSWPNRDRFVLSAGHGSMLLYALLYLTGYNISLEDLMNFRQWSSPTPGHPERAPAHGIETTTGPLGQGFGTAVGMAMAERYLATTFNRPGFPIVDHRTFVIASDGDMMEGISSEAASLAGHLRLGRLIVLYDNNKISIDGPTDLTFTEDVSRRFEAYGWHVENVEDGNDLPAIYRALERAVADGRPSLINVRTHIGYGSPKQDTAEAHGAPLGPEAVRQAKLNLGWPLEPPFFVPEQALAEFRKALDRGKALQAIWEQLFTAYRNQYPDLAEQFLAAMEGRLPEGLEISMPNFLTGQEVATRAASGKVLSTLVPKIPYLLGGSADLSESTQTYVAGGGDFGPDNYGGRNIHFGVREHAMGAAMNGMAVHGGIIPYGGTFLVFSDYMRPSIRIAALMGAHVIYVFTHDSIGLGEDGPTHQPVEHLSALRAMPNLTVIRPADANEVREAWLVALERSGPVALVLSRQKLPVIDRSRFAPAKYLRKGAYILADGPQSSPELIIIATGSEVHLALQAWEALSAEGRAVRIVNMPSWELFEEQDEAYKADVLPPAVRRRLVIEAGVPHGWHRYALGGDIMGIEGYGASAPGEVVMDKYGFNLENVLRRARALLDPSGR